MESSIALSPSSIDFLATGGQQKVHVTTDGVWVIDVSYIPSWIEVTPSAGNKAGDFTVWTDRNSDLDSRTFVLKIQGESSSFCTLSITQSGTPLLYFNTDSIDADYHSQIDTVLITATEAWTVEATEEWIIANKYQGLGNDSLFIALSENTDVLTREGKIILTGKDSGSKKQLLICQSGSILLNIDPQTFISESNDPIQQMFRITANEPWHILTSDDWYYFDKKTGSGSDSIFVLLTANPNYEVRSGEFQVSGDISCEEVKVCIEQGGKRIPTSVYPTSLDEGSDAVSVEFKVTSQEEWIISCVEDWISINKTSGVGNDSFVVTLTENQRIDRKGEILLECIDSGDRIRIPVQQKGNCQYYTLDVDYSELYFDYSAQYKSVNVTSNDSWTVSSSDEKWLTVSKKEGSYNDSFRVYVTERVSSENHTGYITVRNDHGNTTRTIYVTQTGKYYLSVSPTNISLDYHEATRKINVTSNDTWTVTSDSERWLSVEPSRGSGNASFTIKATERTSAGSHTATITVKGEKSGIVQYITINQTGQNYYLTVSRDNIKTDYHGGKYTVSITSNEVWNVQPSNGWYTVSPKNGSGDGSVTIDVGERTSKTSHQSIIKVIGINSGIEKEITVYQTGKN